MKYLIAFFGGSPGAFGERVLLAFVRSLWMLRPRCPRRSRFGARRDVRSSTRATGRLSLFAVVAAAVTSLASFLHNVAGFLPNDPTQTKPPPRP